MGGRPHGLRQFGKGGTPSRTLHAMRRTALASTFYGIRGGTEKDGAGEPL